MSAGSSRSPERGGVPWAEAVSTGPSSSCAPGPPSSQLLLRTNSPKTKKSCKPASSKGSETTNYLSSLEEISAAAQR